MERWKKLKNYAITFFLSDFSLEEEIEVLRRVFLINLMLIIGITFTFLLGSLAFIEKGYFLFLADLILFLLFIIVFFYLRKTKNYKLSSRIVIFINGIFFLYFILSGGVNNTAFVWAYVYPLISFFLLGTRNGLITSFLLIFFSVIGFLLTPYLDFITKYDTDLILRFVPSYITVVLITFVMEETRQIVQHRLFALNQKLRKANQFKTDILNITVHDLKNPLNTIQGVTEMMKEYELDNEENSTMLEVISRSSKSMLSLINDFLESSKIENEDFVLNKNNVQFGLVLSNVLHDLQSLALQKNQTIELNIISDPVISSEEYYLQKIIQNLVGNSIKYSEMNKRIIVELNKNGNFALFTVSDEGQGFSEQDKAKLFERFNKLSAKPTANESSSGLGLFIVKKLVDLHNGKIWLESKKGEGSKFFVQIPIAS